MSEVVIIGAGAAGCLYAAKLAKAGKSVTVLEAGPEWTQGDLVSSQIWARRLRWGGPSVAVGGDHPMGFAFNAGWGFGGSALHHYGTWPRMQEEDFRMHSLYGRGVDWPFDYDELRPYYDRIQEEVGISGDAEAEIWRPKGAPYPLPPLKTFAQADVIKRGFDKLGIRTSPMPLAILSEEYKGRPACLYDGWCDAGCPIGALANPLVTYKWDAEDAGAVFKSGCYVTRLLPASKNRAAAVAYVENGEDKELRADVIILAASVVHNPAILLNSVNDFWPQGAGNEHDQVGRNFMTHSVATIAGLFEDETEPHMGVTGAQLTSRDGYAKNREGAFGSYHWLIAPAVKPNDLLGIATSRVDLFGPALDSFMKKAAKHFGNMLAMGEELPNPDNRVVLDNRSGPGNTRLPRIEHSFDKDALGLWQHMIDEGLKVFKAAGAIESWNGPLATAHMMGGTVMGHDADTSVCDTYGRVHNLTNVIAAGPGLYPTGSAVNPTFTLHALSLRNVEHLLKHWSDYAKAT